MADLFRLVTIGIDGRARLELELNDLTAGIYRERDSFSFTPAPRRERALAGDARYQGGRVLDTAHDNATATVVLNVTGAGSVTAAAGDVEALLRHADRIVGDGDLYLEWRPSGLPRSVFMPLRGPATVKPTIRANAMAQQGFVPVEVSWPVAPLAEGLPMDVDERWTPPPDKAGGLTNEAVNPGPHVDAFGWVAQAFSGDAVSVPLARTTADQAPSVAPGLGALEASFTTVAAGQHQIVYNPGSAPGNHLFKVTPGEKVSARLYGRFSTGNALTNIRVSIGFFTAADAFLTAIDGTAIAATGAWQEFTHSVTVPANAAWAYVGIIGIGNAAGTVTLRVGGLMLVRGNLPAAYMDGDSVAYRWEGIRGQSRSLELVESASADYVAVDGVTADPVTIVPDGLIQVGHAGVGNTKNALYHAGRGYMVADAESIATGYFLGASGDQALNPGLAYDPADNRYFACMLSGGQIRLYYYDGSAFTIVASAAMAALTVGKVYSAVVRKTGNRLEGELWAGEPVRGGTPLNAVSFDLTETTTPRASQMGETRRGYGMPRAYYLAAGSSSVIKRWRFLPYSITPRTGSPHPFLLKGIPGNAPAKAKVEVSTGAGVQIPFALLGWRTYLRHDYVWNGDFAQDLDGWSSAAGFLLGAGATPARVASGGPNDAAYLQVTSAAVANTGTAFIGWTRLRAGRSYTVEFFANQVSGTWELAVAGDGAATISQGATALAGAAGVWTRQQITFRNAIDRDRFDLTFRQVAATAGNVLRIAAVRMWEGLPVDAPPPNAYAQQDGRGAYPPFGILHAMGDDPSSRVGFAMTAVAGSIAGQRMRLTAPTLTGALEWLVDPNLMCLDDNAQRGEVDVEVYAMGALGSGLITPRVALSVKHGDVTIPAAYTREDGSVGKPLVLPLTGTRDRAWRLGTVTLVRDPELAGATRLRLDFTLGAGSTGYGEFEYLLIVPRRARAGSPTGLVYDGSYPTFLPAQAAAVSKTIRSDLTGIISRTQQSVARTNGLGGAALELTPGDVELVAWMQEAAVPDDPIRNDNVANDANVNVHVAVTPRYRLLRDA